MVAVTMAQKNLNQRLKKNLPPNVNQLVGPLSPKLKSAKMMTSPTSQNLMRKKVRTKVASAVMARKVKKKSQKNRMVAVTMAPKNPSPRLLKNLLLAVNQLAGPLSLKNSKLKSAKTMTSLRRKIPKQKAENHLELREKRQPNPSIRKTLRMNNELFMNRIY
ncbi:hypothetical protein BpHYR1_032315 [Brachionus plicatilis]|uniref:Uncharacterized protein n=1 Tax=Brachionus plicatilis TaxID=10195 RepID=A0A3M7Q3T0_BRAPC|nr:hypothetical protein BpHYR1_032315 [Brachionus plicatilis]